MGPQRASCDSGDSSAVLVLLGMAGSTSQPPMVRGANSWTTSDSDLDGSSTLHGVRRQPQGGSKTLKDYSRWVYLNPFNEDQKELAWHSKFEN